jgi:molybdopterin/thiamine biosynthesis adenylyltransferase
VVGAGGTGSAVVEELARLGVGTLSVFDGETFDPTNVNRVYGSAAGDGGREKAAIAADLVRRTGLQTTLHVHPTPITREQAARQLRDCDVVFGCADTHAARGILVRLALWYLIPVFDLGVRIDAPGGVIRGVHGRVTTLLPGEACLFCRGRISPELIRLEALSPQERRALADEHYAPELEDPAPAVIPFTTAVAAQAVTEFLHRLTGFMGEGRRSTEALLFFHEAALRTNRAPPRADCLCSRAAHWGRGDTRDFLGLLWPTA